MSNSSVLHTDKTLLTSLVKAMERSHNKFKSVAFCGVLFSVKLLGSGDSGKMI